MHCPRMAVCLAASLILLVPASAHAQASIKPAPSWFFAQNTPATPPAQNTPATPQAQDAPSVPPAQGGDAFGEEVTLAEKTIIYMNGNATWDSAFETLIDAFKQLNTVLDRQGLKADG